VHASRPSPSRRAELRQRRARPAALLAASLGSAVALGIVLYVVTTSLPYLAASPTTDPTFGRANQCLIGALPSPRVSFAVSWTGTVVAGYSGAALAVCGADGGLQRVDVHGVQMAAWDALGTLWIGSSEVPDAGSRLWFLGADGGLVSAGDFAPIALAGHASGALALDAAGRLASLSRDGSVMAYSQLPAAPVGAVHLAVSADGSLASVVAGGGLFAYQTADLSRIRAEAPCELGFVWWLPQGDSAVLGCGPHDEFALRMDVRSGEREAAPERRRVRSTLVPGRGTYVESCEQLPCTASPP
jgi:hypothetical protein